MTIYEKLARRVIELNYPECDSYEEALKKELVFGCYVIVPDYFNKDCECVINYIKEGNEIIDRNSKEHKDIEVRGSNDFELSSDNIFTTNSGDEDYHEVYASCRYTLINCLELDYHTKTISSCNIASNYNAQKEIKHLLKGNAVKEIIGLPITLPRVVQAIWNHFENLPDKEMGLFDEWQNHSLFISQLVMNGYTDKTNDKVYNSQWKLTNEGKDCTHLDQTEETVTALYELIK